MDPEKRKREGDGDDREKKMINKKNAEGEDEEEEQVEEFFAILERIHAAVKYFEKADGSDRSLTAATAKTWKPSFEVEDFEEDDSGGVKDPTQGSSGLDLNSEPVKEGQQRNII